MVKEKYYTVWKGYSPGVYKSWKECYQQIHGYEGAIYKSFNEKEEAERAYSSNPYKYIGQSEKKENLFKSFIQDSNESKNKSVLFLPSEVCENAIAVDAACSGNPGKMEYRGIYLRTGREIFHYGPVYGTNNIGEFLAIVHALALLKQKELDLLIYSDSKIAIGWVTQKRCKTNLLRNEKTVDLFGMITRAESWLNNNIYSTSIIKWETDKWGEIPADFGRKK